MYISNNAGILCGAVECFKLIDTKEDRRQLVLNYSSGLSRPEPSETKYRLRYARRSKLECFFGQCNPERRGAFGSESLCASDCAMTVCVGLQHGHDLNHFAD